MARIRCEGCQEIFDSKDPDAKLCVHCREIKQKIADGLMCPHCGAEPFVLENEDHCKACGIFIEGKSRVCSGCASPIINVDDSYIDSNDFGKHFCKECYDKKYSEPVPKTMEEKFLKCFEGIAETLNKIANNIKKEK